MEVEVQVFSYCSLQWLDAVKVLGRWLLFCAAIGRWNWLAVQHVRRWRYSIYMCVCVCVCVFVCVCVCVS
jgi:hypothetical protein